MPHRRHCQQWFFGRYLLQQVRQHCNLSDRDGGDADSPHLQCLGIDADMQCAPSTAALRAVVFSLPLAFSQELDACGANQQVQAGGAKPVHHLHIYTVLAATQHAK